MNRIVVSVVALGAAGLTGCAAIPAEGRINTAAGAKAYMDSALTNDAEPASVWNRPQEVGFDFGAEITGEAQRSCILGFICWGAEDGTFLDSISALFGGGKTVGDPLVRAAAASAVANSPRTDGIFVVSHETDQFNVFFFFSHRSAKVRGKSFTLRPLGEVSQERADKVRNLKATGGRALINLPMP